MLSRSRILISPSGEAGSGVLCRSAPWLRRLVLGGLFAVACWAAVAALAGQAHAATPPSLPPLPGTVSGSAADPAGAFGPSRAADTLQQGQAHPGRQAGHPPYGAGHQSSRPGPNGTPSRPNGTPSRQNGTASGGNGTPPGQGLSAPGQLVSRIFPAVGSIAELVEAVVTPPSAPPAAALLPAADSPLPTPAAVGGALAAALSSGDSTAPIPRAPAAGPRPAGRAAVGRAPVVGAPGPGVTTASALPGTSTPLPLPFPQDHRPAPFGLAPSDTDTGPAEGGPGQAHELPLVVVGEVDASLAGPAPRASSVPPAAVAGALPELAPRPD